MFALSLNPRANQPVTIALNKFIGQYGTQWNDLMAVSTVVALPIIVVLSVLGLVVPFAFVVTVPLKFVVAALLVLAISRPEKVATATAAA